MRSELFALLAVSLCSCSLVFSESTDPRLEGDGGTPRFDAGRGGIDGGAGCLMGPLGECVECLSVTDCGSRICDPRTLSCGDEDSAVYVANDGSDFSQTCSQTEPCASIQYATQVASNLGRSMMVFLSLEDNPLDTTVHVASVPLLFSSTPGGGAIFTLYGENVTISTNEPGAPVLEVLGGARIEVVGLELRGLGDGGGANNHHGAQCRDTGTYIGLVDAKVSQAKNMGVRGKNCAVTIHRSRIVDNHNTGVSIEGGSFEIINTLIANNGHGGSYAGGVHLANDLDLDGGVADAVSGTMLFTTVIDNTASQNATDSAGVRCINLGDVGNSIVAAGSIVQGNTADHQVYDFRSGCVFESSVVEGANDSRTGLGDDVVTVPVAMTAGYELQALSAAAIDVLKLSDVASALEKLRLDLGGRSRIVGSAPDMGAFERQVPAD